MNTDRRRLLIGATLAALSLAGLVTLQIRPVVHAAEGDEVEYTFDRPITQGEEIYNWYRKTHADEAAKRCGVDPDATTRPTEPGFKRSRSTSATTTLQSLPSSILIRNQPLHSTPKGAPEQFLR